MMHQYQLSLIIGVLTYLLILTVLILKKKVNIRYAILWLSATIVMLVLAIFPQLITNLAGLMGITEPVNLLFVFQGFFVLLIVMYLTSIVSWLTNRLNRLAQRYALMEKRLSELEASLNAKSDKKELEV